MRLNKIERRRLTVKGVVQGVGFRPFVYGLATRLGLAGHVGNDSTGVFIEIEGTPVALDALTEALLQSPPPLAHIEHLKTVVLAPTGEDGFGIVQSRAAEAAHTLISPDLAICDDCLRELFDPADRRYRYPFINCTNCGPRFTIICDIPYDRSKTTMTDFPLCPACQREYDDPGDRRFHAQPNACSACGPRVTFRWVTPAASADFGRVLPPATQGSGDEAISAAQSVLAYGGVVAVKGIGGFHLACDATNQDAVEMLRRRKGRIGKPFALMARDVATIRAIAHVDDAELALLTSRIRPIVLLRKREDNQISDQVAPGNNLLGVMLPYSPLHYLLLDVVGDPGAPRLASGAHRAPALLVMTSGNHAEEPIVKENDEAIERLAGLADAFLLHDRPIQVQCDDSVVRVEQGQELPIRRSRGYAPFPVRLPLAVRPILAVGGELKSTFCLTQDDHAFLSQHIGDMQNLETLHAFEHAVAHMQTLFRIAPERLACDLHPGYLSTHWAERMAGERPLIRVQHHHAHIAALMAEHGLDGRTPVIGFAFDGTGYGPDGAIWGGEVLVADYRGFERAAHLAYFPLPGGDAAIRRPWRTALAALWAAGIAWDESLPPIRHITPTERGILRRQLETALNTAPTSSMGRLFDVVAALLGIRQSVTYEAQAAIELEAQVDKAETGAYAFAVGEMDGAFNAASLLRAVVADIHAGVGAPVIAARFHNAVVELILALSLRLRKATGLRQVGLSGGVFQNVTLLRRTVDRLDAAGFTVLTHQRTPPNDGGLALGQAIVAHFAAPP